MRLHKKILAVALGLIISFPWSTVNADEIIATQYAPPIRSVAVDTQPATPPQPTPHPIGTEESAVQSPTPEQKPAEAPYHPLPAPLVKKLNEASFSGPAFLVEPLEPNFEENSPYAFLKEEEKEESFDSKLKLISFSESPLDTEYPALSFIETPKDELEEAAPLIFEN